MKTIKALDINDFRILKHIIIIADRKYGEKAIGNIYYNRSFSENYKFEKDTERENKSSIERLLEEYPKQENYPNDKIDNIIFKSVKDAYPKSMLRNHLIIFNTDLEKLKRLKNKKVISGRLFFEPTFEDYSNLSLFAGKEYKSPLIKLKIYSDYTDELRENEIFSAKYFLNEKNLIKEIKSIKFE